MPVDVYEPIRDEIMRLLDNEGGVSLPSFFEILLTGRAKKRVGIFYSLFQANVMSHGYVTANCPIATSIK